MTTEILTDIEFDFSQLMVVECYGMDKAKSSTEIASRLGIDSRELRKLKRHMFLVHHKPVGSTQRGYFWAKNDHEMMKIHRAYESRIEKYSPMMKEAKNQIVNRTQEELL